MGLISAVRWAGELQVALFQWLRQLLPRQPEL
jgi:hypothetical protein